MSVVIPSLNASLAQLKALADYIDLGSSNATFVFYDDAKPTSVDINANNSAKLLVLDLQKPCVKAISENNIELFPTNAGVATKSGIAKWARLFNGEGFAVVDVDVGAGMDIVLDNHDIVIGSSVKLDVIYLSPLF
ncbi:hypothetical protein DJ533_10495 [Acinetobacter defluvii]|uniref:Uncharacterized protein n=1 Tax=Acinetobacter defluvii TaxID=1871111 RepID=A0A2S2FF63_9GAMM|nr:hypothetical protein [Acinetobacter defluvii]AWL28962.1 hypothetical protein DJ533_10495 [Acinetobacter defluvii]